MYINVPLSYLPANLYYSLFIYSEAGIKYVDFSYAMLIKALFYLIGNGLRLPAAVRRLFDMAECAAGRTAFTCNHNSEILSLGHDFPVPLVRQEVPCGKRQSAEILL
jgi:hypothetical protein